MTGGWREVSNSSHMLVKTTSRAKVSEMETVTKTTDTTKSRHKEKGQVKEGNGSALTTA